MDFRWLVFPPNSPPKSKSAKNEPFPLEVLIGGNFRQLVLPLKSPPKSKSERKKSFPLDVLKGGNFRRLVFPPKTLLKSKSPKNEPFPLDVLNGGIFPPISPLHPNALQGNSAINNWINFDSTNCWIEFNGRSACKAKKKKSGPLIITNASLNGRVWKEAESIEGRSSAAAPSSLQPSVTTKC